MCKHLSINLLDFDYVTQYLAAFIVSVGLLVEGMHYGWSSSAVPKLLDKYKYKISQDEAMYITQMFTYGSITYTALSIANYPRLNQKLGVIFAVLIMTISWILIGCNTSAILIIFARFFAGLGRGLVYQTSVNYICEISDPQIRGLLGSMILIMTNLGVLLIYSFGPYLNLFYSSLIGVIISLSELIAIKWVPESPYMLLLRGKTPQARIVLRSLRNLWNVEDELDKVWETVKKQDDENSSFWSIFTVRSNRKALLIVIILNAFQALSGINVIIRQILKLSGGNLESYNITIVISMISVVSCTLTALFIDHIGRKVILIISFSASGIALITLGCYIYFYKDLPSIYQKYDVIPLACLLFYTMVYRMGIGLVPLLLSGELFPMNAKNTASSFTDLLSVAINFFTIQLMEKVTTAFGLHAMYLMCGINCFIGLLYTYIFVPETSRKTLEEIQQKLKTKTIT